jgi:group II intron reverse transcriptase/maturase
MRKGRKQLNSQMKPAGQAGCAASSDLFAVGVPVWYEKSGKVSPGWLSSCEEERNHTSNLLESIAAYSNLESAYKQVRKNGGSAGVDGMNVKDFKAWFIQNWKELQKELLTGRYEPQMVKGVEIPKPNGGVRQLGIPTVRDRVVQQAIKQVLEQMYDPKFSPHSYGFRPGRSTHQALKRCCETVKGGKRTVVDIDLEKFFDKVNHQRLLWLLGTRIGDRRLLGLIGKIPKTDILKGGLAEQRVQGTPQGSPLSPLLSNIVLDELDQELSRRGLSYVRYADDLQIFVGSEKAATRVLESITRFIEDRMRLKVNREKSGRKPCHEVNFLGHSLLRGGKLSLSPKSEQRLKEKLKQITQRNRGVSFEQILKELKITLHGWLPYFRYAQMKSKLAKIEGWLRRRLKCFRLKQCKRAIGIVRFLMKLGVEKTLSWRTALSGKGWWRLSNSPALNMGMNNQWFIGQGYYSLTENYKAVHRNPL